MLPDGRTFKVLQDYRDGECTFDELVARLRRTNWGSIGPIVADGYGSRDYGRNSFYPIARGYMSDEDVERLVVELGPTWLAPY